MPILMWIFTASFIAGLVRLVLGILGAVFFSYVGHEFITSEVIELANGGLNGWGQKTAALFTRAGILHAFDIIIAGISARLTLAAFSGIRLGRR